MRILVTGTSGQLGAAIAADLAGDHEVIGVDLVAGTHTTLRGSITDRTFVFSLMEGMDAVVHTASLHAPHVPSHSRSDFVAINIQGTLNLLEAAAKHGARRFVYSSTTSLYGTAMVPQERAVWVTETLLPQPRDVYDVTKIAAEHCCAVVSQKTDLSCISLRVSRFFTEPLDTMAIYRLYRGVDVRDAAAAHRLALHADVPGYNVFNISAQTPFSQDETEALLHDARAVLLRHFPSLETTFARRGWTLPASIDRVYVIDKAARRLDYRPRFNFEAFMNEIGFSEQIG